MSLKRRICEDLQIPETLFDSALKNAKKAVYRFKIPKRNGDSRAIFQSSVKSKPLQYWLLKNVFEKFHRSDAATAFSEGCSILKNAQAHQCNRFFLKVDLTDFFPSITINDVKYSLIKHWPVELPFKPDDELFEIIQSVCFFKDAGLPIGYATSPALSNIVMIDFDEAVNNTLEQHFADEVTFTRYADDMVFSTKKPGRTSDVYKLIYDLIEKHESPKIKINPLKTLSTSSTGGGTIVTGIKVCVSHLTITREQKDEIRLLLSLCSKGRLSEIELRRLTGLISFAKSIDTRFYTKISERYFLEIQKLKLSVRKDIAV